LKKRGKRVFKHKSWNRGGGGFFCHKGKGGKEGTARKKKKKRGHPARQKGEKGAVVMCGFEKTYGEG